MLWRPNTSVHMVFFFFFNRIHFYPSSFWQLSLLHYESFYYIVVRGLKEEGLSGLENGCVSRQHWTSLHRLSVSQRAEDHRIENWSAVA